MASHSFVAFCSFSLFLQHNTNAAHVRSSIHTILHKYHNILNLGLCKQHIHLDIQDMPLSKCNIF